MNKTILVAQREFMENMKTKTFWLGILAAPIGIVLFYAVMFLLVDKTDVRTYAVLDESSSTEFGESWLSQKVKARAQEQRQRDRLDEAYAEALPAGRPLRVVIDEVIKPKRFSTWVFDLKAGGLANLFKIEQELQTKLEAAKGVLPNAEDPAVKQQMQEDTAALKEVFTTLQDVNVDDDIHQSFEEIEFVPEGEDSEKILTQKLQKGEIFAYFVIGADPLDPQHGSKYVSYNVTDSKLRNWYAGNATRIIRELNVERLKREKNLSKEDVASINATFHFTEWDDKAKKVEDSDKALKFAPVFFVYFLWMSIFIAAQMLLTNTVEEKSNRIIEVLLSSVSPAQLMHGKIYGIALTGLTIVGSWSLFFIVGVKLAPVVMPDKIAANIAEWGLDRIASNPIYVGSFLGYFLTGYLLYAAILVAIGSVCNSLKEAQNLQQPVVMVLMVPLATMIPIVGDPNGTLAKIITYIPFYTPFAMMNRAGGPPPLWEWFASSALILVSVWLAFRGAAKIFRVGVLMTGKPPKIREIIKWMRPPRPLVGDEA
jgi:ABC-2 type transport system permease protein